jgi:chromosome partitioning protein
VPPDVDVGPPDVDVGPPDVSTAPPSSTPTTPAAIPGPASPEPTLSEPAATSPEQPGLRRGRILAVANQKGGVGKTTTTINLATALAAVGQRVLIIDLDPQANATTGLGLSTKAPQLNSYDLLLGDATLPEVAKATLVPGLDLVPTSVHLAGAEIELVGIDRREFRLREAVENRTGAYDFVLIDCPPSLGLLTLNALTAADAVLVPLQCEYYALEGISHLIRTVERVKNAFNHRLEVQGVVLTMFDKRNTLSTAVADDARRHFGSKVYETVIPRNVRVSEAPSFGKPVLLYDLHCAGSQAYVHLAGEVLRRERVLASISQQAA